MAKKAYVFNAELLEFPGVRRTVAIRDDQTLVDVHYAMQAVFDWDDDHLYTFWLNGEFWARDGGEYTHPFHAAEPGPFGPAPPSADIRLDRLRLTKGQRIAYLFDFGNEWRVQLTLHEIAAADDNPYPRILDSAGDAPPQYPAYEDEEDAA